jgi:hypothetical protein
MKNLAHLAYALSENNLRAYITSDGFMKVHDINGLYAASITFRKDKYADIVYIEDIITDTKQLIEQVIGRYMWREHLNDSQLSALENAGFEMHSCMRDSVKIFHKDIKSPLVSWQYNRTIGSKFSWRRGSASYQEQLKRILGAGPKYKEGDVLKSPSEHADWEVIAGINSEGEYMLQSLTCQTIITRSEAQLDDFHLTKRDENIGRVFESKVNKIRWTVDKKRHDGKYLIKSEKGSTIAVSVGDLERDFTEKQPLLGTEAHTLVIDDADYLAETAVMQAQSLQAELNEANSERMGNHLTEELREQMNEIKEQSFLKIFLKQSENTMANSPMNTMDAREAVKGTSVEKTSLRIKKVTYFGGTDITALGEDDLIFGIENLGAEKETLLSAMKGVKSKRVTKKIEEIEDTIEQLVSLLDALED